MHLIHVAAAEEETASTARHVSLAFAARERATARALCAKKPLRSRERNSGICDKLREFYGWLATVLVVWEGGGRNPVRSVIPATLIYLGAPPDRDGGGRWIGRAGEKEWAEFVSAAVTPPPPLEKIQDIRSVLPLGKQSAKLGHRTDCSLGGSVFKQLCEQFQSSFCLLILHLERPLRLCQVRLQRVEN